MSSYPVMSYGYPVTSGSAAPVPYGVTPTSAAPVPSFGMQAVGSIQPVVYSQTIPVPVQTTQTVMENQVSWRNAHRCESERGSKCFRVSMG